MSRFEVVVAAGPRSVDGGGDPGQVDRRTVFQASLTGHQVLTTFHAGRAVEACGRLLDMGIEPYVIKSGLLGILSQRLVRRLCSCSRESQSEEDRIGWPVRQCRVAVGCGECDNTGYRGVSRWSRPSTHRLARWGLPCSAVPMCRTWSRSRSKPVWSLSSCGRSRPSSPADNSSGGDSRPGHGEARTGEMFSTRRQRNYRNLSSVGVQS